MKNTFGYILFIIISSYTLEDVYSQTQSSNLGNKSYEVTNHLGNVMAVVSDRKTPTPETSNKAIAFFETDIKAFNDYYPYGMLLDNRNKATDYRFGFQGQEKDDGVKGNNNSVKYKYRVHDPRLGRFFGMDSLSSKYPHYSTYQFSGNKPIQFLELEGLEEGKPKIVGYEKRVEYHNSSTKKQKLGTWLYNVTHPNRTPRRSMKVDKVEVMVPIYEPRKKVHMYAYKSRKLNIENHTSTELKVPIFNETKLEIINREDPSPIIRQPIAPPLPPRPLPPPPLPPPLPFSAFSLTYDNDKGLMYPRDGFNSEIGQAVRYLNANPTVTLTIIQDGCWEYAFDKNDNWNEPIDWDINGNQTYGQRADGILRLIKQSIINRSNGSINGSRIKTQRGGLKGQMNSVNVN